MCSVKHTGVTGGWAELWCQRPTKQLLVILAHTVKQVTREAVESRWPRGQGCSTTVLVPSVQPFQQVHLKMYSVGPGPNKYTIKNQSSECSLITQHMQHHIWQTNTWSEAVQVEVKRLQWRRASRTSVDCRSLLHLTAPMENAEPAPSLTDV